MGILTQMNLLTSISKYNLGPEFDRILWTIFLSLSQSDTAALGILRKDKQILYTLQDFLYLFY